MDVWLARTLTSCGPLVASWDRRGDPGANASARRGRCEGFMLQWTEDLDDMEGIAALGRAATAGRVH